MAASIYNTAEWQRVRKLALTRDDHRCAAVEGYDVVIDIDPDGYVEAVEVPIQCNETIGLDVHHITPISRGGDPFDLDNLTTFCDHHHAVMHAMLRDYYGDDPLTDEQVMVADLLDAVRTTTRTQHSDRRVLAAAL